MDLGEDLAGGKAESLPEFPDGKRYRTYVGYSREKYGERLQKLVIDAGFTCPNRDGTVGWGGCTYCDNAAFHPGYSSPGKSIAEQLSEGIEFHKVRYRNAGHYLAYFQSYSNTYAPLSVLLERWREALSHPSVVGIVVGTRPDCVDGEKLDALAALCNRPFEVARGRFERPVVVVEYGIESCYDLTLRHINRGHDFACAQRAVAMTAERGLDVGAHFIFGLPGETPAMMLDECAMINDLPLTSVKFHQLQIIKGTAMEREEASHPERFTRWTLDEYLSFIVSVLQRLRPTLAIERVAGEVPPRFVNESRWGLIRNFEILRLLDARLSEVGAFQGQLLGTQPSSLDASRKQAPRLP